MSTRRIGDLKLAILLAAMALGVVLHAQQGEGATADCDDCRTTVRAAS
jgi:hypothetical protein